MPSPVLLLPSLLSLCFTLAAWLQPRFEAWGGSRVQADNLLALVIGDGRRLFANHFFVKADAYFHAGYYPTIFDSGTLGETSPMVQGGADRVEAGHSHDQEDGDHGRRVASDVTGDPGFLGPPHDIIDRISRHFFPSQHVHLERPGEEREIMPWLWLSAALDPQRIETYTVAGYWLRSRLGHADAAARFLREGWRANPDSFEILFELGRLYEENFHENIRAHNVYELALRKWDLRYARDPEADPLIHLQLLARLARIERGEGRTADALGHLRLLKKVSPHPELVQRQIDELERR